MQETTSHIVSVREALGGVSYPGRGILIGMAPNSNSAYVGYFLTGRSANSRNRIFKEHEDGSLTTEAFDASLVEDPSLIIYRAIADCDPCTIVTNGAHTENILRALQEEGDCAHLFEEALRACTYEPDAPHYTPRISGILARAKGGADYQLSILKKETADNDDCARLFYHYHCTPGVGHLIHTYAGDGDPLPAFAGDPLAVSTEDDLDDFAGRIWDSLDADNRIALYLRKIEISTGIYTSTLLNAKELS